MTVCRMRTLMATVGLNDRQKFLKYRVGLSVFLNASKNIQQYREIYVVVVNILNAKCVCVCFLVCVWGGSV